MVLRDPTETPTPAAVPDEQRSASGWNAAEVMKWRRRVQNHGVVQCLGQLLYPQLFSGDLQRFLVVAVPIDTAPAAPAGGTVISIAAAVLSLRTAADTAAASGAAAASAAAASTASVSTPAAAAAAPLFDTIAAAISAAGTDMPAALLLLAALQATHEAGHAAVALAQRMKVHWPPRPLPGRPFGAFGTLLRPASVPPDASALFDFAAAGPTAGALASLVMLVAGLQATAAATPQKQHSSRTCRHICFNLVSSSAT
eukprot:TRINITY_DN5781_c0_g1_i3.p2 TRINITY_DN5781_c0_g1~~TRINITY_DN5781_c0_g1_i3.p2  ORF type:complete len:256 (-),score=77.52 TRINITY_DN5781_c0_g1_i3:1694-2461(-)